MKSILQYIQILLNRWKGLRRLTGEEYIISDTHFSDQKMIEVYKRKYKTWNQMNQSMIAKWNLWISNLDTVIFLGDFARVKYHEEKVGIPNAIANLMVLKWSKMWFIKGNHDTQKFLNVLVHSFCNIFVRNVLMTKYEDYVCVFIHDPANFLPVRTDEKIIVFHGHLHGEKTFAHESIKSRMRNIRYIDVSWDKLKHPVKIKDLINR